MNKELLREAKDSTSFCTGFNKDNAFECMGVLFKWVDVVDGLINQANTVDEDLSILVVEPVLMLSTVMVNNPNSGFSVQERGKFQKDINDIRQARTANNAIELKQKAIVLCETIRTFHGPSRKEVK